MTGFQAPPSEIAVAANSCTTTATNVQGQLAQLKTYVTLTEESWQGIAQDTFQELMQKYDTYSQMLVNALNDIASGLNGNKVNYVDTEIANIKSIHAIDNEMQGPNYS